ncbi:helix-turn-helix transcriptional regulator [Shewanella kaireitica]|uniref:helix-turn-helix transcriptional regulator n=1 Tax=Shewanella kaireitica TaxID=212021 RepID=UPI00200E8120|nr:AlpA family transcriptional regulator [Shewanella kaireitica]MCL1093659.1 AlpA family transcriptional regulator [Shewanella kaireitica]
MFKKVIRLPEVKNKTGLSRSSIYLRISKGEFPASTSLGGRAVGWFESDIDKWLDECIAASKAANNE